MKLISLTAIFVGWISLLHAAEEKKPDDILAEHREGANKVADKQDELSADVQQLTIEQTVPQVIELFREASRLTSSTPFARCGITAKPYPKRLKVPTFFTTVQNGHLTENSSNARKYWSR